MGKNKTTKKADKKTSKLSIKKETLRKLDSLKDDDLRRVAGGYWMPSMCPGNC